MQTYNSKDEMSYRWNLAGKPGAPLLLPIPDLKKVFWAV